MKETRSIFWAMAFLVAGIVWLLVSMNVISAANLWALTHILPYLLIGFGLGLILRSFWRPLGTIITVLVFLGIMASIWFAPQMNWADAPKWTDVADWDLGDSIEGAVPGSGVVATETRKVSGFDSIKIRFPAEVTVTQGTTESLTIEGDDNLLPQLGTTVESGTLVIENTEPNRAKRVNPGKPVKIMIVVKTLKDIDFPSAGTLKVEKLTSDKLQISLGGAGDVTLSGLKLGELEAVISGAGTINADGEVDEAKIVISGFGSFKGSKLSSREANVVISGAGSATLRVEQELTAQISGAGSVNYYGDPEVTRQVSGAGSVNKAGD